jgi:hypothetical protein
MRLTAGAGPRCLSLLSSSPSLFLTLEIEEMRRDLPFPFFHLYSWCTKGKGKVNRCYALDNREKKGKRKVAAVVQVSKIIN